MRNPTTAYRHEILRSMLEEVGRSEDLPNIIKAYSPPKDITTYALPNAYPNIKIGIIGAGLAGLSCAYEIAKLGCSITIFEANKERIGGRVYTYYFDKNLFGELGAMRIPLAHECTWHYLNLFRINTVPFISDSENNILYVNKQRIRGLNKDQDIMTRIYPFYPLYKWEKHTSLKELDLIVLNEPLYKMSKEVRLELLQVRPKYHHQILLYDALNFFQVCDTLGFSDGGKALLYNTMGIDRGFYYSSYLELMREVYPLNFYNVYKMEKGFSELPKAFLKHLQPNVKLKMNHLVTDIINDGLNNQVALKYRTNDSEEYERFDYVICAIPFSTMRLINIQPEFSQAKKQAIMQVHYETSQKTLFLCKERFWERTINNRKVVGGRAFTDLVITSVWYPTQGDDNYGVLMAAYGVGQDANRIGNMTESERITLIKRQLEELHGLEPYYLDKIVLDYKTMDWEKDPHQLGAYAWYYPGQNRLFLYPSYLPEYNNKVFFAGEHIAPNHGWMQGALQTGMVIANNLAIIINHQKPQFSLGNGA